MCTQGVEEEIQRVMALLDRKEEPPSVPESYELPTKPTCDICGKTFDMNIKLKRHKKTAHADDKKKIDKDEAAAKLTQEAFDKPRSLSKLLQDKKEFCVICNSVTKNLEFHLFQHQSLTAIVFRNEPDLDEYACDNEGCVMTYQAKSKKSFLMHKYFGCPLGQGSQKLYELLDQFTLGDVKKEEEKLLVAKCFGQLNHFTVEK